MEIYHDYASNYLRKRWFACYMLYDYNISHATNSFYANENFRHQSVSELLEAAPTVSDAVVTETYNRVLAEDVERFIQFLTEIGSIDRLRVEIDIAEMLAEIMS